MGCGTGLVGKYLVEEGFKNITGLDCSKEMLSLAEEKKVYTKLDQLTLGVAETFPNYYKNQFDIVTCSGLINNNHLDYELFEEMTLACKQNGLIVFAARFSYLGDFWYNEIIQDMANSGRWKFIKEESFFKYDKLLDNVGRFSRTPTKVFAYLNLEPEGTTFKKKEAKKAGDGMWKAE